jgi:hypothetical protein
MHTRSAVHRVFVKDYVSCLSMLARHTLEASTETQLVPGEFLLFFTDGILKSTRVTAASLASKVCGKPFAPSLAVQRY